MLSLILLKSETPTYPNYIIIVLGVILSALLFHFGRLYFLNYREKLKEIKKLISIINTNKINLYSLLYENNEPEFDEFKEKYDQIFSTANLDYIEKIRVNKKYKGNIVYLSKTLISLKVEFDELFRIKNTINELLTFINSEIEISKKELSDKTHQVYLNLIPKIKEIENSLSIYDKIDLNIQTQKNLNLLFEQIKSISETIKLLNNNTKAIENIDVTYINTSTILNHIFKLKETLSSYGVPDTYNITKNLKVYYNQIKNNLNDVIIYDVIEKYNKEVITANEIHKKLEDTKNKYESDLQMIENYNSIIDQNISSLKSIGLSKYVPSIQKMKEEFESMLDLPLNETTKKINMLNKINGYTQKLISDKKRDDESERIRKRISMRNNYSYDF